jgi:hypothetical protein
VRGPVTIQWIPEEGNHSVRAATFTGFVTVALLAAAPALAGKALEPEVPAMWARHALIVDLDDLPKSYTCDELWYRFRALLLQLGARADSLNIMPYHCTTRSPSVEVQFAMPEALSAARAGVADFQAHSQTVSIFAGHPAPFDAGDCELMRQIHDVLLPELPVQVVRFQASCTAADPARQHFDLQLQAFEREPRVAPAAAPQAAPSVAPATALQRTH